MKRGTRKTILATRSSDEFVGRNADLDRLLAHARGESAEPGLALLSAPAAGTSELLKQTYDRLFATQTEIVPFYFEIKATDSDAVGCACRMAREFLTQAVAFRRKDAKIIANSPDLYEISRLAPAEDIAWIDALIETLRSVKDTTACAAVLRSLLGFSQRCNAPVFVMVDGAERSASIDGLCDEIVETFAGAPHPFVLAGHRRFLFAKTEFPVMPLERLQGEALEQFVKVTAAAHRLEINEASRDLIGVQLEGDVRLIRHLFGAAAASGTPFTSFENVERIYTDEIFGGRIARHFDALFESMIPEPEARLRVVEILAENLRGGKAAMPLAYWRRQTGMNSQLAIVLRQLNAYELVDLFPGSAGPAKDAAVFHDYLRATVAGHDAGGSRAKAVGETLASNLKRAPMLMAGVYRRQAAIGLGGLISNFKGQSVAVSLMDYGHFAGLKGADDAHIKDALAGDEKISLPDIAYTASTVTFYPKLADVIEPERTSVGIGFDPAKKERVYWLTAEIDSKLEADKALTEFWCDRIEMAALACDLSPYTIWLVSPEGFSPEALKVLKERSAYGSSRKQVELLKAILGAPAASDKIASDAKEYEFVIPMGSDSELIAARALDDVAKRHHFVQKTTNQVKTALIEACINAAEHSLSPDGKLYQKFIVSPDKIVITVANRGVRLADRQPPSPDAEARRGWGLRLIQGLMDDVALEETDDGTRITMTKHLAGNLKNALG